MPVRVVGFDALLEGTGILKTERIRGKQSFREHLGRFGKTHPHKHQKVLSRSLPTPPVPPPHKPVCEAGEFEPLKHDPWEKYHFSSTDLRPHHGDKLHLSL